MFVFEEKDREKKREENAEQGEIKLEQPSFAIFAADKGHCYRRHRRHAE